MNKQEMIGIGIIAVPFLCIGSVIGGVVMNKINNKHENNGVKTWRSVAILFKEQLCKEIDKNDKLKKELEEKEA